MGISTILLIGAVVCFVLALFEVTLGDLELVTLGLALFAEAFLVRGLTSQDGQVHLADPSPERRGEQRPRGGVVVQDRRQGR